MANKNVELLLKEYKESKALGKRSQKAATIFQSESFLTERAKLFDYFDKKFFEVKDLSEATLNRVTGKNPLLAYNHPRDNKTLDELGYTADRSKGGAKEEIRRKNLLLEAHRRIWEGFCTEWNISTRWNGEPGTFSKYIQPSVRIGLIERATLGQKEIFVSLDEWATQPELIEKWRFVEKLQREALAGKIDHKSNHPRDFCWLRMRDEEGYEMSEIAEYWIKNVREDVEILVIRRLKDSKKEETRAAFKNVSAVVDDLLLLKEIKSGKTSPKLKELFEQEWNDYVIRETPRGKITPPFENTISIAIRRIRKEIKKPLKKIPPTREPFKMSYMY